LKRHFFFWAVFLLFKIREKNRSVQTESFLLEKGLVMQVLKKSRISCCNHKRKRPVSNVPGKNTNMKTHILDLAKFLPQKTVFDLLLLAAFWQTHEMHEMSIKFPFLKTQYKLFQY
jgi:hypothetical protein